MDPLYYSKISMLQFQYSSSGFALHYDKGIFLLFWTCYFNPLEEKNGVDFIIMDFEFFKTMSYWRASRVGHEKDPRAGAPLL